jgi:hypothetical protein
MRYVQRWNQRIVHTYIHSGCLALLYIVPLGTRAVWGSWPGRPDWENFRPLGDCLLWAAFWKFYKSSPRFLATFFRIRVYELALAKKPGLGHVLGDLFKNSFGRPVPGPFVHMTWFKVFRTGAEFHLFVLRLASRRCSPSRSFSSFFPLSLSRVVNKVIFNFVKSFAPGFNLSDRISS